MGMQLSRKLAVRSVLPIAVVGLVLAGCTTKDPGNPTSSGDSTTTGATTGTSEESTTTSAPTGGGADLAKFDPCAEMNAVAGQLSLTGIEEDGKQACMAKWGNSTTRVRIRVYPELGIADVVAKPDAQITETTIGSHKAKIAKAALSKTDCDVSVEITAKSRVDFFGAATASADEACDAAKELAEAVEPKLPK
ncbi:DUF3558 family protein [Catellatospora bangladeshensis]